MKKHLDLGFGGLRYPIPSAQVSWIRSIIFLEKQLKIMRLTMISHFDQP